MSGTRLLQPWIWNKYQDASISHNNLKGPLLCHSPRHHSPQIATYKQCLPHTMHPQKATTNIGASARALPQRRQSKSRRRTLSSARVSWSASDCSQCEDIYIHAPPPTFPGLQSTDLPPSSRSNGGTRGRLPRTRTQHGSRTRNHALGRGDRCQ